MQGISEQIANFGAKLVALTPQLPEHSQGMVDKHNLSFDLLSDPGNEYAAKLGIRFEVPQELKAIYQSFGINLEQHNGDDSWTLPMPGRFVVGNTGTLEAVSVDPDYTHRPEPETVLEALDRL
ncbi:MAG: peroxiredoxin [Gammaproteobacteria bacterium]